MNKIRIKHFEHEIEIEGTDDFIKSHVDSFYLKVEKYSAKTPSSKTKVEILEESVKTMPGKKLTPAEYYKMKNKNDGLSQVLIFGKYLEDYEGLTDFTKSDVDRVAKLAKLAKNIHSQYFTNAVKQGLLRTDGKGKYSLTLSAESVLSSM